MQYGISKGWLDIDHEWLEENFVHVNQISIKDFIKLILKVKRWKHIKSLYSRKHLLPQINMKTIFMAHQLPQQKLIFTQLKKKGDQKKCG